MYVIHQGVNRLEKNFRECTWWKTLDYRESFIFVIFSESDSTAIGDLSPLELTRTYPRGIFSVNENNPWQTERRTDPISLDGRILACYSVRRFH